tara:strand:+ start:950 stop:1147 length:198 start_codon:yes stop_codon:yes gene_type:complete
MIKNILLDIGSLLLRRVKEPTSAVSIAVLLSYFGISDSELISESIQSILIGVAGLYGILRSDKSE